MQGTEGELIQPRPLNGLLFYCANHSEAGQLTQTFRGQSGVAVKAIGLPCCGKMDLPYLAKAFETGADGVAILCCQKCACQNLEGAARACKRAESMEALLEEIGMGAGRVAVLEWGQQSFEQVSGDVNRFFEKVGRLPHGPAQNLKECTVA